MADTTEESLRKALDGLLKHHGGGEKRCGHDYECICAWNAARAALALPITPSRVEPTALEIAKEIEAHCPCGARPNSPSTHPHVLGCPVYRLVRLLGGDSISVRDNYEKAVR